MPKLPGVNHQDAVRALEQAGFWIARQGKHIVMTDGTRIIVIPRHNPVNAITTKTFRRASSIRWLTALWRKTKPTIRAWRVISIQRLKTTKKIVRS